MFDYDVDKSNVNIVLCVYCAAVTSTFYLKRKRNGPNIPEDISSPINNWETLDDPQLSTVTMCTICISLQRVRERNSVGRVEGSENELML